MKKTISLFSLLLALLLAFSSCGGKAPSVDSLMESICALFPDMPATESAYSSNAQTLSEQDAAHIYQGEYGDLAEWAAVESYAVRLPDQPQVYEIHILKVKNDADVDSISKLLCRRADLLAKYFISPEKTGDFDYSTYKAEVYVKGNHVFLLATPDNAKAIALIEKSL